MIMPVPRPMPNLRYLTTVLAICLLVAFAAAAKPVPHEPQAPSLTHLSAATLANPLDRAHNLPGALAARQYSLLNGRVTLRDDGIWQPARGGYWSMQQRSCGRGIIPDMDCLDTRMFVLQHEPYRNPDQFQVNVTVFKRGSTPVRDWTIANIGLYPTAERLRDYHVGSYPAFSYEAPLGPDEKRLVRTVIWQDAAVVVRATLFNQRHNHYSGTGNYLQYGGEIDRLTQSIVIRDGRISGLTDAGGHIDAYGNNRYNEATLDHKPVSRPDYEEFHTH